MPHLNYTPYFLLQGGRLRPSTFGGSHWTRRLASAGKLFILYGLRSQCKVSDAYVLKSTLLILGSSKQPSSHYRRRGSSDNRTLEFGQTALQRYNTPKSSEV